MKLKNIIMAIGILTAMIILSNSESIAGRKWRSEFKLPDRRSIEKTIHDAETLQDEKGNDGFKYNRTDISGLFSNGFVGSVSPINCKIKT